MKKFAMILSAAAIAVSSGAAFAGGPVEIETEQSPVVIAGKPTSNGAAVVGGVLVLALLFGLSSSSGSHGSNISN